MTVTKIGVATSIFKEKSFDSFSTLEYAEKKGLSSVQLYLNEEIQNRPDIIDRIREKAASLKLEILCHSPYSLNREIIDDGKHIASLSRIFPKNQRKLVVLHFDENITVNESVNVIQKLNRNGITVCLENFYTVKDGRSLIKNINSYNLLMAAVGSQNLDCIPVIDFPRLFIEPFLPYNPIFLTGLVLDGISRFKKECFLHLIDFNDSKQDRESWTPIGTGLLPIKAIKDMINHYDMRPTTVIMEFEEVDLASNSIAYLNDLWPKGEAE